MEQLRIAGCGEEMIFDQIDYLPKYSAHLASEDIAKVRVARAKSYDDDKLKDLRSVLASVPRVNPSIVDLSGPVITVGHPSDLSEQQGQALVSALEAFRPWKKGPFNLFGTMIDAEWRSDMKWQRIKSHVGSLQGLRVADIGCNNGYFMFRMAAENPELVVGFEPFAKNLMEFEIVQSFAQAPNLYFELLGIEHMGFFPDFFDKVFCLGVLYHQTDPIDSLRKIFRCLKPGGQVIIDCQGIPGDTSVSLFPAGRYAQARGIWHVPTLPCLINWLRRTQFREISCFYQALLSTDEQRTTAWAPVNSLRDFLDPDDSAKTIEGYPAPWRFYLTAVR